jgi:hypothetical protein
VNGYALIAGQVPAAAAGTRVFHLVLGAIFVLGLRRAT